MTDTQLDICGREIGTFDGWDQLETTTIQFYDYKPKPGIDLPAGDMTVDYDNGTIVIYNDADKIKQVDLIDFLKEVPRNVPL